MEAACVNWLVVWIAGTKTNTKPFKSKKQAHAWMRQLSDKKIPKEHVSLLRFTN